jgi:hypothetical protein
LAAKVKQAHHQSSPCLRPSTAALAASRSSVPLPFEWDDGAAPFFWLAQQRTKEVVKPKKSAPASKVSPATAPRTRSHDKHVLKPKRNGLIPPSKKDMKLFISDLELIYFHMAVVPDSKEACNPDYCTHTLVTFRLRDRNGQIVKSQTISYQQHGLTFGLYNVEGSFDEDAAKPRFCSTFAATGFPTKTVHLAEDVQVNVCVCVSLCEGVALDNE